MKSFFKNMTFPRFVIVFCLLASAVLGWFAWENKNELDLLTEEKAKAGDLVGQIQDYCVQLDQLQQAAAKENLKGAEADADFYIRKIASDVKEVNIGDVNVEPSKRAGPTGAEDYRYTIKSNDTGRGFHRSQIANFLYRLEADSRRVRVTSIDISPEKKKVKPHEVLDDSWVFKATITMRRKIDS